MNPNPMDRFKKRVLVVDDDSDIRSLICEILHHQNLTVAGAKSEEEARTFIFNDLGQKQGGNYDLILLDIGLGTGNGLRLLNDIRQRGIFTPVLMISGTSDLSLVNLAAEFTIKGFLVKPFSGETLVHKVKAGLKIR